MEENNGKRILFLAVDSCGESGGCALAEHNKRGVFSLLGEKHLEGRSFSATLITAIGELLSEAGVKLKDLTGLIVVNGPGSFTGVRVGLSAVKGLAEAEGLPLLAVSRLEVMTATHAISAAALDAHRHELFLRVGEGELLAGAEELAAVTAPQRIAVCDDRATELLSQAWPQCEILRVAAPTAADALKLGAPHLLAGERADVALLDGHYLRRSDAEIFGDPANAGKPRG